MVASSLGLRKDSDFRFTFEDLPDSSTPPPRRQLPLRHAAPPSLPRRHSRGMSQAVELPKVPGYVLVQSSFYMLVLAALHRLQKVSSASSKTGEKATRPKIDKYVPPCSFWQPEAPAVIRETPLARPRGAQKPVGTAYLAPRPRRTRLPAAQADPQEKHEASLA